MADSMWGAQLFLHNLMRRIRARQVGDSANLRSEVSPRELNSGYFPSSWNILLFGAPNSGKSSLIYTLWRSLAEVHDSALERVVTGSATAPAVARLSIDWNYLEFDSAGNFELDMESYEEPTVLMRLEDQSHTEKTVFISIQDSGEDCSGITLIDTPGISDLSADAVALISGSVDGTLSEGSGFGILPHPSGVWYYVPHRPHGLAPHVVAIVMDMSLPSFQDLLDVDVYTDENWSVKVPQLVTYHAMIDVAIERGLQVFVILTHLDNYHKSFDNIITRNYSDNRSLQDKRASEETEVLTSLEDIQNNENTSEDGRLGEDMLGELKGIYLQLSQSLSYGGRDVPPDRMFVVENYRNAKRRSESRLALAAAEGLDAMLDAADIYIHRQYQLQGSHCSVS